MIATLAVGLAGGIVAAWGGESRGSASAGAEGSIFAIRTVVGNPPRTDLVSLNEGGGILALAGESTEPRTTPASCCVPAVSADGATLFFSGAAAEGRPAEILALDLHTEALGRLTEHGRSFGPVLAPGAGTVAFSRLTRGSRPGFDFKDGSDVWVMDAHGDGERRLFSGKPGVHWTASSYSPAGGSLLLTRTTINRPLVVRSSVWIVRADGAHRRRLTRNGMGGVFSPNGDRIAFSSDRDRNGELCYGDRCRYAGELYLMNTSGSSKQRITKTAGVNEVLPSWSPDASQIAYQRGVVTGNAEAGAVFAINADGSCRTPLARRKDVWFRAPAWHPASAPGSLTC